MSELKAIRSGEIYNIIEYEDCYRTDDLYYPKSDVDAAIAEIKDENTQLKAKLESVQATAYTENVDAGMRERRLKRALWLARAKAYRYIAELIAGFNPDYVRNRKMFTPNNLKQKQMNSLKWAHLMLKIESKCRAKAEEYK